jgi:outer membrane receptor protein involved in Fe transport
VTSVQLTTSAPAPGQAGGALTSIATNQGDAEVKGLELELQAAITEHLRFGASYAYVNAKFTSGCDDFQYTLNTGGLLPTFDTENPPPDALPLCSIAGNRLPLGSPHQVSVSADLNYPITASLNLVANVGFSFEDQKFVQVHNLAKVGTTELLSARIGITADRWEIALFGRNLTDEDSIPIATRWFDLRYGFAPRDIPLGQLTAEGKRADTGLPRAFFAGLRKGRQIGLELKYRF